MTTHPILPTIIGLLLSVALLSMTASPAEAEADKESDGGGHGGDGEGDGKESDGEARPKFDGPLPPLPWEIPRASENACSKEEIVVLRELRERSEQLEMRSAALDERERAIEQAEQLLTTRLAKVEQVRADIVEKLGAERNLILSTIREEQAASRKLIEAQEAVRLRSFEEEQEKVLAAIARDQKLKEERLLELAGIVATMKPKAAAAMLGGMDEGVALQVLLQVKPKTAGKILAAMPAGISQTLGDKMTVHRDPRGLGPSKMDSAAGAARAPKPTPTLPRPAPAGVPAESTSTPPKSN